MLKRRVGWGLFLLLALCLYFFENNTGTRIVLAASLLLPLLSIFSAGYAAKRAACTLDVPRQMNKGESALCRCAFAFPGVRAGYASGFRLLITHSLSGQSQSLDFLTSEGKTDFPLSVHHCGCLRVRLDGAFTQDLFGLTRFPIRAAAEKTILVLPELYPVLLDTRGVGADRPSGPVPGSGKAPSGEADGGIRPYLPGDPTRQIHWKLSAKADQLLIRESETFLRDGVMMLLETSAPAEGVSPQDTDAAAEALLSASRALAETGLPHSVCWQKGEDLTRMEVENMQDFRVLAEEMLLSAALHEGESVGRCCRRTVSGPMPENILLFSPHPDTDALCLLDENTVTLALPEKWSAPGAGSGIRVVPVGSRELILTL